MKNVIKLLGASSFFILAQGVAPEKNLTVIISSYNNKDWYRYNLDSVVAQKYSNYQVIYIDDHSPDGTAHYVERYIKERNLHDRITLIKNTNRRFKLANMYNAIHACDNNNIIVELDGDDWLAHDQVFSRINQAYTNSNTWIAYAQFVDWPTNNRGYALPTPFYMVKDRSYRRFWNWSGLRSYYCWLAKKVKLEDLLFHGDCKELQSKFFPTASDAALMYPMLEMAAGRIQFIPEVLLMRNVQTPLNDFKVHREIQKLCGGTICAQKPYTPLKTKPSLIKTARPAIIIYTQKNDQLNLLLESISTNIKNTQSIVLLCPANNQTHHLTTKLQKQLPSLTILDYEQTHWSTRLKDSLSRSEITHALLVTSTTQLDHPIDLRACAQVLEETNAYAVYFQKPIAPYEQLFNNFYAQLLAYNSNPKFQINTFEGALYRIKDIVNALNQKPVNNFSEFSLMWSTARPLSAKVGLFFNPTDQ